MLRNMRILRGLGEISTVCASKKRLAAAENDRKQTHSLFWSRRPGVGGGDGGLGEGGPEVEVEVEVKAHRRWK
jgi:hypothetical protein